MNFIKQYVGVSVAARSTRPLQYASAALSKPRVIVEEERQGKVRLAEPSCRLRVTGRRKIEQRHGRKHREIPEIGIQRAY